MSLDFKILWFDDQPVDGYKRRIKAMLLSKYCLDLIVEQRKGNEDLSHENLDKYDLILMDYGLIGSVDGVQKFKEIRKAHSYVDVAFYSTKMREFKSKLKDLEDEGVDIEGAYYLDISNHTLFEERLNAIIEKVVRRSESIDNLRGYFLSETTENDFKIYELINKLIKKFSLNDVINDYISNDLHNNIVKTFEKKERKYNEAPSKLEFCMDVSSSIPYLDSANQVRVLNKIIEQISHSGTILDKTLNNFYENYKNEIIDYRNAFAHKKNSKNSITIKGEMINIDDSFHLKMRQSLKKYRELLDKIDLL